MRVLVVEDETRLAETVRRGLAAEGFNVEVVSNGEDGLWAASENAYDVIVLDIMLPKLSGYKVVEPLREHQGSRRRRRHFPASAWRRRSRLRRGGHRWRG